MTMKRLAVTLGLAMLGCHRSPSALVVVSNEDSGDVSIIDPETDRVMKTIAVGKRPRGMKASPDGKTLYVAVSGSAKRGGGAEARDDAADGIAVVDLERGAVVRRLACGRDPEAFDITPDGKRLFVSNEETAQVSEVDIASGRVTRRIDVGREPEGVTIANGEVFVTSEEDARVDVISDVEHRVVRTIVTPKRPRAVAVTGGEAYVTAENAGAVAVVRPETGEVKTTIALGPGARPMGIAVHDGHAFVSNGRGKSVSVIELRDHSVLGTIADVGPRAWGIGAWRDKLYVAAGPDVAVVSIPQRAVLSRLPAGRGTWGVVIIPRSR